MSGLERTLTVTKTGCTVRLVESTAYREHMGPGVMLMLDMTQSGDGRHAEVYLDPGAAKHVADALGRWLKSEAARS